MRLRNQVQLDYANGLLSTLTTPSGQVIGYSYANGRVTGLTVNGAALLGVNGQNYLTHLADNIPDPPVVSF